MTPPGPTRYRSPVWVGLRLGGYLVAVELLVVVLPVMYTLRQSALWAIVGQTLALYAGLGAAAGALVGLIPPLRTRPWALLLTLLGLLAGSSATAGEHVLPVVLFGVPAGAMAWAGTAMAGKPSRLRLALRALVVLVWGLAFLPVVLPRRTPPVDPLPPPPASAPNLVLVVLDTVRQDRLSTYGHDADTSPRLTALAAAGLRYDEARVNGMWSLPSHATIFTGEHPAVHGATYEHWRLEDGSATLAAELARFGYRTVCVTGNPLISRSLGTAWGFQAVDESWRGFWIQESMIAWRLLRPLWDRDRDKGGAAGARFVERWLTEDRDDDRPFFLFVNVMDAHAPYHDVPPEHAARFLPDGVSAGRARRLDGKVFFHHVFGGPLGLDADEIEVVRRSYDGGVHYADAVLGDLLDALDGAGLADDTLVVVTSDHGELLGEHALWGHVHSLYDVLLRVPLVMRYPGHVPAGAADDTPVQAIDLLPTLLSAAGVPRANWPDVPGRDLTADWGVPADERLETAPRPLIAEHFTPSMLPDTATATMSGDLGELFVRRRAVIQGDDKYVLSSSGTERLHDLAADPGETTDLSQETPAALAVPRAMLHAWIEANDTAWPDHVDAAGPEVDRETLERLRELGYVE